MAESRIVEDNTDWFAPVAPVVKYTLEEPVAIEVSWDQMQELIDNHGMVKARMYAPVRYDQARMQRAALELKQIVARALYRVRMEIARQIRASNIGKVAKAEPDEEDGKTPEERDAEREAEREAMTEEAARAAAEELANQLRLAGFDVIVEEGGGVISEIAQEAANRAIAQFGFEDNSDLVDQVDELAVEFARERAAELIGMRYNDDGDLVPSENAQYRIDENTRVAVRDIIAEGLAEGKRSTEIAAELEDLTNGNLNHVFGEERAALIANTEIRRAHSYGALDGMRAARGAGVVIKKVWLVADAPCEECEANGDQGPIDLDDEFDSGDDAPPAHPNCMCALVSYQGKPDDEGDDSGDEEE